MKDYNEKANVSEYKEKKKANIKCSYSLHPIITGKYDSDYHYLCPICGERLLKLDGSISDTCIHCGIKIPTPYISLHKHEYYHNLAGQEFSANVVVNGNMGRFRWGELVEEEASANPLFNADECKKKTNYTEQSRRYTKYKYYKSTQTQMSYLWLYKYKQNFNT